MFVLVSVLRNRMVLFWACYTYDVTLGTESRCIYGGIFAFESLFNFKKKWRGLLIKRAGEGQKMLDRNE